MQAFIHHEAGAVVGYLDDHSAVEWLPAEGPLPSEPESELEAGAQAEAAVEALGRA